MIGRIKSWLKGKEVESKKTEPSFANQKALKLKQKAKLDAN